MIGIIEQMMPAETKSFSATVTSPYWTFLLSYTGPVTNFMIYYYTTVGGGVQGSTGPVTAANSFYTNRAGYNPSIVKYAMLRMSFSDGTTIDSAYITLPY